MKKISTLILILSVAHLLSGCSIASRSNTNNVQSVAPVHQAPKVAAIQTRAPVKQNLNKKASNYNLQKAHTNVLTNNNPRYKITKVLHNTIGRPYKWGGNNPNEGFDCSGLMGYVHKHLGINIPRTAAEQRDKSRTVDYANLKAGDMLFFKINSRTNHVGMYIGDRKFIHAATGKKQVRVASMDSPYWHKRFVKFGTYL